MSDTTNLPFNFTSKGYSSPDFTTTTPRDVSLSTDLKTAINCMSIEADYLKSCDTYVLGYNKYNVQILKTNCIYGGFRDITGVISILTSNYRDLAAYIEIANLEIDLAAYITAAFPGNLDLNVVLKGWRSDYADLRNIVRGWHPEASTDLGGYIREEFTSNLDIIAYLKSFIPDTDDLYSIIQGWAKSSIDVRATLKGFAPAVEDLPTYIKSTIPQQEDLNFEVYKIWQTNLDNVKALLHGYAVVDLTAYTYTISKLDLSANIYSLHLQDLLTVINPIPPRDLLGILHGWDLGNLSASITEYKSPTDFMFEIYGVPSVDLPVSIQTRIEVQSPRNLKASIYSYLHVNLGASIASAGGLNDLTASITSMGSLSNLTAKIYPKVIYVRTILNISFLEAADIAATINYPCYGSAYTDLGITLYSMHNLNLKATLFGTDGSNIQNLGASINCGDYKEINTLPIDYLKTTRPYSSLILTRHLDTSYVVTNSLDISITKTTTDGYTYTKTPTVGKAYVEEVSSAGNTVEEYKLDRSDWVMTFDGSAYYDGYSFYEALDDSLLTYDSTADTLSRQFMAIVTVYPKVTMTRISYVLATYSNAISSAPIGLFLRTNSDDDWTQVDSLYWYNRYYLSRTVDVSSFTDEVGYIAIQIQTGYHAVYFYDISAYSTYSTTTYLLKDYYDFESDLDTDVWDVTNATLATCPVERGTSSLYKSGSITMHTAFITVSPEDLYVAKELDYFECFLYKYSGTDQPAVLLRTSSDDCFLGISCSSSGTLCYYSEGKWTDLNSAITLDTGSWYGVRAAFDWDTYTTTLSIFDDANNAANTFSNIPFNTYTSDVFVNGNPFGGDAANNSADTDELARIFNDSLSTSSYWTSTSGSEYSFFGYELEGLKAPKMFRLRNNTAATSPYNFELRATTSYSDPLLGDVLYTVSEESNTSYWEDSEWKTYLLDNPDDTTYSVFWLINYQTKAISIVEAELFCLQDTDNYNIHQFEFWSTDIDQDIESTSNWADGWNGTSCQFYIDDVYFQNLTYREAAVADNYDLGATITGNPLPVDLAATIWPYSDKSYTTTTKERFIVLKLTGRNLFEWQKYVEVTFKDYASRYYYFSGNEKAYKANTDETWIVTIKGYSLSDLPDGVERSQLRRKYIFSLKNYSTIDEAVRDMTERVVVYPTTDLSATITGEPRKILDLGATISTKGSYKSNRTLKASITGI